MLKLDHITAGFTAVVVGYTSAIILVIQAAQGLGANAVQVESWLLALGIGMGLTSVGLSYFYKIPILIAWSTPGAALLISLEGQYSLAQAIPAFVVTGLLISLTALVKPLNKALSSIPSSLSSAMLAAILLPFCVDAFTPASSRPEAFAAMFFTFIAAKLLFPKFAMLILLIVGVGVALAIGEFSLMDMSLSAVEPAWMGWQWNNSAIVNIALPLYIITMLSQNLPGFAMLKNYDYAPPNKSILLSTGFVTSLLAPIGAFSINLAAITAAICMNENVDERHDKRYLASMSAGVMYVLAGIWGSAVVSLFLALPKEVSMMLAGLALLSTLALCLKKSLTEGDIEPALLTFLVTLSGVSIGGINSTLLGLLVGLGYMVLIQRRSAMHQTKPLKQLK
ncbi:benzoate/H(+) symporter BenE family transporter [Vibrio sp. FNV 38]|nr:benzoate/H(+) symporter BenE family transporter [Vibrio sp. FNV 38]